MIAEAPFEMVLSAITSAMPVVDRVCLVVAPESLLASAIWPKEVRLVIEPWQGFSVTRSKALAHAESDPEVKWIVMIDADDVFAPGACLPPDLADSDVDSFEIPVDCRFPGGRWRWLRAGHFFRAGRGFHWRGTGSTDLHEVLVSGFGAKTARWDGLCVRDDKTIARAGEKSGGRTYEADTAKLATSLAEHTDPRAQFYYAQSLKDAGHYRDAYQAFRVRSKMSGFFEDTYWAKMWSAKLAVVLGLSFEEQVELYLEAHEGWPERAEALAGLASVYEAQGAPERAIEIREKAARAEYPTIARSFVDVTAYSSRALSSAGVGEW